MTTKINIRDAFKTSAIILYRNISFLLLLLAIYIIAAFTISFLSSYISQVLIPSIQYKGGTCIVWKENTYSCVEVLAAIVIAVCSLILKLLAFLAVTRIFLDLYEGKRTKLMELFTSYTILIPYILADMLFALLGFMGMLLFIIPGLIFMTFYYFYDIVIVDQDLPVLEAFAMSRKLIKNQGWNLFIFIFLSSLLMILSLGILYPVILMARIDIYKKLRIAKGL